MVVSRVRTIFQSLDTARYQKDGSDEKMFDTAHARSEALSALLFGHEIIIPAGVIADCPAFLELFGEIMGPSEEYRMKLGGDGEMYRPFRIALERRFDTASGLSGYDAFFDDYRRSFTIEAAGKVDLVSIDDLAGGAQRSIQQQQRVAFLVDAFLNKKWKDVRAVSENYADHIQRVYSEFSPRVSFSAKPAWATTDLLSTLPGDYYRQRIETLCRELEKREVPLEGIAKLRSLRWRSMNACPIRPSAVSGTRTGGPMRISGRLSGPGSIRVCIGWSRRPTRSHCRPCFSRKWMMTR